MKKILKNDKVVVLTGKDKGLTGTVLQVFDQCLLVDGINLVKKHIKPNPSKGIQGGIISKNMPIHISNVAVLNGDGMPCKISIKQEFGSKNRAFKPMRVAMSTTAVVA